MANVSIARRLPMPAVPGARRVWSTARRYPVFPVAILLLVLVLPAIFADLISPHDPLIGSLSNRLVPPVWVEADSFEIAGMGTIETPGGSWKHILGTDKQGRDVLSQLLSSTSSEFILGIVAALVTVSIATTVGAVAAYYGGIVDTFFMRLADLVVSLPGISLLIVLSALIDLNLFMLALVLGVLGGFGGTAIVLKSQALGISVKPYIEAARVAGGGRFHIIFTHIVPNLLPLSFLYMMFTVTAAIFSEAVLSFFGLLNIRMSWGIMIHTASTGGYLLGGARYWWLIVPAGASITLLCSTFYLVGRALDEVANPRLRRR